MGKKVTPVITRSTATNKLDRIRENLMTLKQKAIAEVLSSEIERFLIKKNVLELLDRLTGAGVDAAEQNRIDSNLRQAGFPFAMNPFKQTLADYNFSKPTYINKDLVDYLATLNFIKEGQNVLIFGPSRVGKTHIACGLGYEAILHACPTFCVELTQLIVKLTRKKLSKDAEETLLTKLQNKKLLIIDEIREQEVEPNARTFLFRLIKERHEKGRSIIFTSMQTIEQWKSVFSTDRDSVIGRIQERAVEVIIKGNPYKV